jgi:hypothetical protein
LVVESRNIHDKLFLDVFIGIAAKGIKKCIQKGIMPTKNKKSANNAWESVGIIY